jgi:translocation and assembly module TamB
LRVDLDVAISRNFWVQAPGTAVELSADVQVDKALGEPFVLSGSVTTVRGFARYYGKKFEVEAGQVTFTGSAEINPHLDVTVTHTVADYVIAIHLGGTIRQPEITFSSTPELPQTDILSLLVLGKTSDRLTGSEQSALSSQIQQFAGGVVAGRLEEAIGEGLGLDAIEITPGETLGSGTVSVGRYVSQKLYISIGGQFGADGGPAVSVEYSITPRLKLEVTSSDTRGTAVDFLWRRDY